MRKTLFSLGIAVAAIVVTTAVVAGISSANFDGNKGMGFGRFGGDKQEMQTIFENQDFNTWKETTLAKGIDESLVTEENFQKMIEIHNLIQAGDTEEAMKLKKEVGDLGFGAPFGKMGSKIDAETRDKIVNAIESGNYTAWKDAVGDRGVEVSEDEFPRLQEAHQLMKEGKEKIDAASKIHEEIGLQIGGRGMGMHRGMMR